MWIKKYSGKGNERKDEDTKDLSKPLVFDFKHETATKSSISRQLADEIKTATQNRDTSQDYYCSPKNSGNSPIPPDFQSRNLWGNLQNGDTVLERHLWPNSELKYTPQL